MTFEDNHVDGGHADIRQSLAIAHRGLRELAAIVDAGAGAYIEDVHRRRSLALCWVTIGHALKGLGPGVANGSGQFALAIAVHHKVLTQSFDKVAADVLWRTSVRDAPVLCGVIEQALADLGPAPRLWAPPSSNGAVRTEQELVGAGPSVARVTVPEQRRHPTVPASAGDGNRGRHRAD